MRRVISFLANLSFALAWLAFGAQRIEASVPSITSIALDGTNVIVRVDVPEGIRKVTLEGRSRLEGSTWAPKALKRFEFATTVASEITFVLPQSESIEVLRIRTDETDLPINFFRGTNQFAGPQSASGEVAGPGRGVLFDNFNAGPSAGIPPAVPAQQRAVVESDIWKVSGDTIYFFNNLRGLQVIDASNPDAPVLKGSYSVTGYGEQMYVLPSGHAVLMVQKCGSDTLNNQTTVLIISANAAPLTRVSEISVPGTVVESRLVGTALYIAGNTYERATNNTSETWVYGTKVSAIDLANPAAPVLRDTLFLPGSGNAITATDRFLFVATQDQNNYYQSRVRIIDISSPDGAISSVATVSPAGRVEDKFKINLDGDVLTIISLAWDSVRRWTTTLQTYSLTNPDAPVKLGSLRLAEGEQLHGTRFDGKRAYIVTFFRIDPLWIVDLTDPANPTIAGELHVPGWSTYLQPMGDRVLALGIDDTNSWRVALSLFDVSNIQSPTLLSKVVLGQNSSWSEANNDEKALTVLADAGLVLVPYSGYTTNGYASNVQLIDLGADTLTKRGQITGQINPRRATLHRDHIFSISGSSLVSYGAANRDQPLFKATLDLAWPVNRVLLSGNHLIEIENGSTYSSYGPASPVLRVAAAKNPDTVLSAITLSNNSPIVGATIRDGKLYLAQSSGGLNYYPIYIIHTDANSQSVTPIYPTFEQTIWDLGSLPALTKTGSLSVQTTNGLSGDLTAHWPKPGLLVWGGGNAFQGWWGWGWGWGRPVPMMGMAIIDTMIWPGWWGGDSSGRFLAFDVSNSAAPVFKSEVDLTAKTARGLSFSKGVTTEGMIYVSHQAQEFVILPPLPTTTNNLVLFTNTATGTFISGQEGWNSGTNVPPRGVFVTRYFLDVIDYADAASPVIRKPINIPGHLQGVSHAGGVLYTLGHHFSETGESDFTEWLDASAYDGVAAFLVDSLNLRFTPHPLTVNGADIFIAQSGANTNVDRWRLSDMGKLEKLSTTTTAMSVHALRFIGDLAIFDTNSEIWLYDATDRTNLKLIGAGPTGCMGGNSIENGDGALGLGFWRPLGDYGVDKISIETGGQ